MSRSLKIRRGSPEGAGEERRLSDHDECHGVTEQHSGHENVAKLTTGRHDDRGVIVPDEHRDDERHRYDTDYLAHARSNPPIFIFSPS